jgi:hypothetical protein
LKLLKVTLIGFCLLFGNCAPIHDADSYKAQVRKQSQKCPIKFKKVSLCAQLIPQQDRAETGPENEYQIKFWDPVQATREGPYSILNYQPKIVPWMIMPDGRDHGTFPVNTHSLLDKEENPVPGVYNVTRVRFTMRGEWQIKIKLLNQKVEVDEAIYYETVY